MKIIGIGPYVGDFEQELLTFRPYVKWLSEVIEYDEIYLNTHINRRFLYDFIEDENIIPVYETFSRDEFSQNGYIHGELSKKDFLLLVKKFKDKIISIEECNKSDVEIYHLNYSKILDNYPHHNKIFNEIKRPDDIRVPERHKNKIVFIPDRSENIDKLAKLLKFLQDKYDDVIVVGNMESWFSRDNVILRFPDYFENGWKYILCYILESKGVICPISYWTSLCNLQKKPVFSWGKGPGQYRKNGILNFDNKDCITIPFEKDTNISILIKSVDFFIEMINKEKPVWER